MPDAIDQLQKIIVKMELLLIKNLPILVLLRRQTLIAVLLNDFLGILNPLNAVLNVLRIEAQIRIDVLFQIVLDPDVLIMELP